MSLNKKTGLGPVQRILPLLLAVCLIAGILPSAAATFVDISDPDVAVAAAVLEGMGITNGVSEGAYDPGSLLSRAQFCTFAIRTMGLEDKAASHAYKTLFTDVKPGAWYTGYINLAYSEGIINGYGNGRFGPDDSITYGQAATLLLRILGYSASDVGNVWPIDYTNFANDLGLADGVSAAPYASITRGQAAILLYNTLKTEKKGSPSPYYSTVSGVASTKTVIILDNNASSGGSSGMLMTCSLGTTASTIEYYGQKYAVSDTLLGYIGTLLLNSAGKTVGFIPDSTEFIDVAVSSSTASAVTSASGLTYRISAGATVIYNGSLYNYGTTGYLQVNGQPGKTVRLFYDDNDSVRYIYIASGSAAGSETAIAETNSSESELARKLGITGTGYSITKNGSAASGEDLAQYDVAYYDRSARTMHVSDYKVAGYISGAYPSVGAAETLTVAGCELDVLESAWDTLGKFALGDRVTLLLTDDNKVAAAYSSQVSADMLGIDRKSTRLNSSH